MWTDWTGDCLKSSTSKANRRSQGGCFLCQLACDHLLGGRRTSATVCVCPRLLQAWFSALTVHWHLLRLKPADANSTSFFKYTDLIWQGSSYVLTTYLQTCVCLFTLFIPPPLSCWDSRWITQYYSDGRRRQVKNTVGPGLWTLGKKAKECKTWSVINNEDYGTSKADNNAARAEQNCTKHMHRLNPIHFIKKCSAEPFLCNLHVVVQIKWRIML